MGGSIRFEDLLSCPEGPEREERIRELVSVMTLEDKLRQMAGDTGLAALAAAALRYNRKPFSSGGDRRLGIPPLRFIDGPRGAALGRSTCFPAAIARGAAFDPGLAARVASAIAAEARAQGANMWGGVCVNLLRHPGWGRAQETFGEDPFHLGSLGAASVEAAQRHLMACVKHFACNSVEESRFYVDVRVGERTLREVYLPHFKECVETGAAAVMSAYNRVNGEFCGHHRHLLRDILKGEWGFDGPVLSDFIWGVRRGTAGVAGGVDVEMPRKWRYGRSLQRAVRKGLLDEALIDDAVARVLRVKARFAEVGGDEAYGRERVVCREHVELAREAARKGMVLLKNDGGTLPLDRNGLQRLAVIGPLADRPNLGDRGSSTVRPPYAITPLQGMREKAGEGMAVEYADGLDLAQARRAARRADAAVIVAGLTAGEEGEYLSSLLKVGGDRTDLALPQGQSDLIEGVSEETDRCVVVLVGGSAITMEGWHERVAAVLMCWYPGMEGGRAIAEVLFGDEEPGGRLPVTFPRSAEQLPPFDNRAQRMDYGYLHGYRHFDREGLEPLYPFGHGLGYTRFEYTGLELSAARMGKKGRLEVKVGLVNAGERAGEEVVQVYVGARSSRVERPAKELKGFKRVALQPGASAEVVLEVEAEKLAYYDEGSRGWVVEEGEYAVYAGPSSRRDDRGLEASFRII